MSVQFASASSGAVDLAAFASRAKEIDIGGDDVVELGDDLGMGLLSNPNKVAPSPKGAARQVSIATPSGSSGGDGGIPQINIRPVDDLDVVNLDAAPGASDIRIERSSEPAPFVINTGFGGGAMSEDIGVTTRSGMSPEEEAQEKQKYLTKLRRLESGGLKGARMSMSNSLEEIKAEHDRLTDDRNLEASIRFQRNALMTFVSGVEMVNDKFGNRLPVKPKLKGWSESVHANVEDFDEIFEELYDLYKDKAKMHPLMRLVGTLGVSATMYHLTNSMAERSGIPGMSDMLNEDPELQRMIAQRMAAKMGGLGQFMSAAGGFDGPGPAGAPYRPPQQQQPPSPPPRQGVDTRVPFGSSSASSAPAPQARREMRGPSGVDDILKAFEAERLMQSAGVPISSGAASVFTPAGPPPSPPRGVSVLREGAGTLRDPLAEFMMDDGGSVGTGTTMNSERRRGRRRAVAAPVGSTLDLNV
jgi:hypothetical protein